MSCPALPAAAACVRRLRPALGTLVAIEAYAASQAAATAALESAFAALQRVEASMHPSRTGSTLARINAAVPGTRIEIDAATHQLLELSRRLYRLSDRAFDPCLPELPGCLDDLEVGAAPEPPWVVCHAPVALDFGGLAKGYAVDRAVEALCAAGAVAGLVNAGGDLRLFGARHETLFVRRADGCGRALSLGETALAVSDLDARERPLEHRGYYVRGASRAPARRYAAVLAATAVVADALTKCVLLCPEAAARAALAALGARNAC